MTLDEAVAEFERGFVVVVTGDAYRRPWAGAPDYATVVAGGVKEQGERHPCMCASPDDAAFVWLMSARAYAAGKGDALVWRERPNLVEEYAVWRMEFNPTAQRLVKTKQSDWNVYSRFIVVRAVDLPQSIAA